jgi:hypothetical protein
MHVKMNISEIGASSSLVFGVWGLGFGKMNISEIGALWEGDAHW